jgi:hypothetical protein
MRLASMLLVLAALVLAGVAGAATLDRARVLPAKVTALDMTDQAVATATAWAPGACEGVDLWSPDIRGAFKFRAPGPCPATSTGRGIASVATSYNRVAWLGYAGGNTRDYTLWTATRTAKRPIKLRFASADVDAPAPIVLGNGGEGGIPYAVGADVYELSDQGARVLAWHAPARVVALAAGSNAGNVAALLENGHLAILTAVGKKVQVTDYAYAPGGVRAFRIASIGTVVNTTSDIEIRTGSATKSLGVGPGARLVGYSDGNVVYTRGNEIRDHFGPAGKDVLLRHVKAPFLAEFDRRGLAWSTGRAVCFAPRVYFASPISHAPGC